MTDGLIAFLTARLDEDEAAAMAATGTAWAWEATGDKDSSWAVGYVEGEDGCPLSGEIEHGQGVVIDGVCESINGNLADAAHIARRNPARALREVAAGRMILARYEDCLARMEDPLYSGVAEHVQIREYEDFVLPNLAAVYSEHPDYDQEWAP